MAYVWLRREDCELGNLPDLCLRCGGPTTERVVKDFRTTLVWTKPSAFFGANGWPVRVPMCNRHRHYWRHRAWLLAAIWVAIPMTAGGFLSVVLVSGGGLVLDVGAALFLLLLPYCIVLGIMGRDGIHAREIQENGIMLANVNADFARAYEMRKELSLDLDRAVAEEWRGPHPPG